MRSLQPLDDEPCSFSRHNIAQDERDPRGAARTCHYFVITDINTTILLRSHQIIPDSTKTKLVTSSTQSSRRRSKISPSRGRMDDIARSAPERREGGRTCPDALSQTSARSNFPETLSRKNAQEQNPKGGGGAKRMSHRRTLRQEWKSI